MDVSLFLQNVAMSSVASASAIPLRMLTLAQLVGKRSTTNGTTPFIYEVLRAAQERRMDRRRASLVLRVVSASNFLSSGGLLENQHVTCKLLFRFQTPPRSCYLQFDALELGPGALLGYALCLFSGVVWFQSRRKGVRPIGIESCGYSLFLGLPHLPRKFPCLGSVPKSWGTLHFFLASACRWTSLPATR